MCLEEAPNRRQQRTIRRPLAPDRARLCLARVRVLAALPLTARVCNPPCSADRPQASSTGAPTMRNGRSHCAGAYFRLQPIAVLCLRAHHVRMTGEDRYRGHRAGAIASAVFVAGAFFVLAACFLLLFVAVPEGGSRNMTRENIILGIGLSLIGATSIWLGAKTKHFFDQRAGRT